MFENEYTMSKKLTMEYIWRTFGIKALAIGLPLSAIAFLEAFLFYGKEARFILVAIGISMLLYPFVVSIIMFRSLEKMSKLLNDGKLEKTQVIFDDNIIVLNEGKVHLELNYDQMDKVIQSKNFIIVKTKAKSAVLVYKQGFVKGDKDAFLEFISKKIQKK